MPPRTSVIRYEPPPANREAERAAKLPKGKPTAADAPPLKPFPGKPAKSLPGQLSIFEQGS